MLHTADPAGARWQRIGGDHSKRSPNRLWPM